MRSLQETINKKRKELGPLEDELDGLKMEKTREQMERYVGKCYKFKNRYSYDKPWWLFIKVIKANPHDLDVIECEKDCYGIITIKKTRTTVDCLEKRIQQRTFDKMLKKYMKEIA